jgi:hypothetical protein
MTNKKDKTKDLTLELPNSGDKLIFKDFEAEPPRTDILIDLFNIPGFMEGKNNLYLAPIVIRQGISKKGQLIDITMDYVRGLSFEDGLALSVKVAENFRFLVSLLGSTKNSKKKESKTNTPSKE